MKKFTLQTGETVHEHVLESEHDFYIGEQLSSITSGTIEFELKHPATVSHVKLSHAPEHLSEDRHSKIILEEKGRYIKYPQLEYDPFLNRTSNVYD